MKKNTLVLSTVSIAVSLMIAACGGGGGNDSGSSGSSTTPHDTASGNLQISVPTPTYASGSAQAAVFSQLNSYRAAMGVGQLRQDPLLDTSASAHALYLVNNFANGNITAVSHNEVATFADYYEVTPLSRARKAGVPATEWVGENAAVGISLTTADASGADCVNQYLNTVYHLQGATDIQETIGVGFRTNSSQDTYGCVLDFGETTNVSGTPKDNALLMSGGQQMPTNASAVSPYPNETNVALTMVAENPNPAPDLASPGRPVMYRVTADQPSDELTVSNFTLSSNGSEIPSRVIVPNAALTGSTGVTADVNGVLAPGVAFLLPLAPLAANTTYTVTFSGQRDGKPVSQTWTFTTGS